MYVLGHNDPNKNDAMLLSTNVRRKYTLANQHNRIGETVAERQGATSRQADGTGERSAAAGGGGRTVERGGG